MNRRVLPIHKSEGVVTMVTSPFLSFGRSPRHPFVKAPSESQALPVEFGRVFFVSLERKKDK